MNIDWPSIYDKAFDWGNGKPKPEWEPTIPEGLPEDIAVAMERTQRIDREKALKHEARLRQEQLALQKDLYGVGYFDSRTATGMAAQQQSALQNQNAMMRQQMDALRQDITPELWSNKLLESLKSQTVWRNTMNSDINPDGVMRIHFPFGEVQMDISNESELDRAFEMAKHMLKVHEENKATRAIKDSMTKANAAETPTVSPIPAPRPLSTGTSSGLF